eukprot:6078867-Amphidinium_carterae.1
MQQYLHNAHGDAFALDFIELCGGVARSTVLACRYSLKAGPNFDLVAGIDLNLPEHQAMTVAFVRAFKPLCVLMGPTCAPFGGWSRLNQARSPEGWSRSFDQAAPHGALCGEIAGEQVLAGRAFACEQPASSKLWLLDPWPRVLTAPGVATVTFDQCRLGQSVDGLPARKPTTLVSNSPEILYLFEGLVCRGHHNQHADLAGGRCSACQ